MTSMRRAVDALGTESFDVLILGGGITGAGVALDCATRGWRTALIDKGDFAAGTSSVSSKLIHGGLRYLEHLQFPLVYEALQERRRLLANAPHLVQPLQFLLPFYRGDRVPGWQWRLGLTLYDLLAGRDNLDRSRLLSAAHLQRAAVGLRSHQLTGGAAYYDAQMDDARLCLEVLKTATRHGARLANYVEAVGFELHAGAIVGVQAHDHVDDRQLSIRARQVVNATGPWLDSVCRLAGDHGPPRLQPTKGVHLVLPERGLAAALLLLHPRDGRVFFVIPWLGKTLVGTTDTPTSDDADNLQASPQDIDYLLEGYRHFFPADASPPLLGTFAGLRPLLGADASPSARSREFHMFQAENGLLSIGGGKYTTYRAMAEEITDRIGTNLGKRARCRTRTLPLASTPAVPWPEFYRRTTRALIDELGLSVPSADRIVQRYGGDAKVVAAYLAGPEARTPIVPGEPELRGELDYQREHEMAVFPQDHLLRRMRLGLYRSV